MCSTTKLDIRKCKTVAGVDCRGISSYSVSDISKRTHYHIRLFSALYLCCFLQPLVSLPTAKNAVVATIHGIDVTATPSALNPADAALIFLQL